MVRNVGVLVFSAWLIGMGMGVFGTHVLTRGEECHLLEAEEDPFDMVNRQDRGWYLRSFHQTGGSRSIWQLCRQR